MNRLRFHRILDRGLALSICMLSCEIMTCRAESASRQAVPTFSRDIFPLLQRHCAACHRQDGIAPMPLLTYSDVRPWAKSIREQVLLRKMPPWKPVAAFGEFAGARLLSDTDIDLVRRWVDAGAPAGDKSMLRPSLAQDSDWQLGKPDLLLSMPEPFAVSPTGQDIYRCFVIPISIPSDRYIAAYEFRPGNAKVLHHAILYLDSSGAARKLEGRDGRPGYESFGGPGFFPSGALGGWSPGSTATIFPDGTGKMVRPGSDLVIQTHYHPHSIPEADRSSIALYFSKVRPEKFVVTIPVLQKNFLILPGATHFPVKSTFTLPITLDVISISPHMHDLGREMKVTALLPNGSELPMIWIRDWDFNWQGYYYYKTPVRLPAGSTITMQAFFDNSESNAKNRFHPPRPVGWGESSSDEMALCFVEAVVDHGANLQALWASILRQPGLGASGW